MNELISGNHKLVRVLLNHNEIDTSFIIYVEWRGRRLIFDCFKDENIKNRQHCNISG